MKKLILFLLFPLLGLAQFSGPEATDVADAEATAGLVWLGTVSDSSKEVNKVQVNDTIVLGVKLGNLLSSTNSITYAHIDVEWNKNAYTFIGQDYKASSGSPQNSTYTQVGYKMSFSNSYDAYNIWDQWRNGSYVTNTDWVAGHFQTQVSSGDLSDLDHYVELKFKVHDAGDNHDYTDNIMISMGLAKDNAEYKAFDPLYAYPNQDFSYEPLEDLDLGGVSVNVDFGDNIDLTDWAIVPLIKNTEDDSDGDGEIDDIWYTVIQGSTFWLTLPANGTIDITDYVTSSTDSYAIGMYYTGTDFKTLYEDIVTISDVQLGLKELVQHGEGAINSGVSLLNLDLEAPYESLNSQDTYKLLAHVTGIEELYFDMDQDGDIDVDDSNLFHLFATKIASKSAYENSSADNFVRTGLHGGIVEIDIDFTSANSQSFNINGTFVGDVNLSHSAQVATSVANSAKSVVSYGQTKKVVDTNMSSFNVLDEGETVVATILLPNTTDLSAAQYRLTYDNTRLEFLSVETDSGMESTNFAKHTGNNINVGSINMLEGKLANTKYVVTFSKKTTLEGVAGLVIVTNTDGANTEAERVEIKIE